MDELILGGVALYTSKELVGKLLGPTADYLGTSLKSFTEKRVNNIGKILISASKKLGNEIESPGQVPPKVLSTIMNEGSYANSDLEVEYYGGILAASRTEDGRDDRGIRLAKLTETLSTYQIRAHYLIYATVAREFHQKGYLFNHLDREKMAVFIPLQDFIQSMDFGNYEIERLSNIVQHVLWGLHAENLIEGKFQFNDHKELLKNFSGATEEGIVCQPSSLGTELFMFGMGHGDKKLRDLFDTNLAMAIDGIPTGFPDATAAKPRKHMLKNPTILD